MIARHPLACLAAALLVTAACSGDDDTAAEPSAEQPADSTAAPAPTEPSAATTAPPATDAPATTEPATTEPATTAAPTTTTPATTTTALPEPETDDFFERGPYEVGVATVTLIAPGRPLAVDVWFPLDAGVDAAALDPHRYTLLPDVFYESPDAVSAGAGSLATDGPFPLVVYSHGSGGLRYLHSALTEAVASHGHIVVAPDHLGNTVIERISGADLSFEEMGILRPTDVGRMIDAFTDTGQSVAGPYAAAVDPERVAVIGHSFGGFTAVASAVGYENGFGVAEPDERVDAIATFAPAFSEGFTDEQLASLDVPLLIVAGTNDITTPIEPNVTRLWDATTNPSSSPSYRVELTDAAHQTFTDVCAYQRVLPTLANVPDFVGELIDAFAVEGCSPGDMPAVRATALTNAYVVGFLQQVFADGPGVGPDALAPPDDLTLQTR